MTGQVDEVVTDLHLSPSDPAAASWVEIGQNQSLVLFLCASLEETGQSLKLLPSVAFFVEGTGQSPNHACSEPSLPVVANEDQMNVFYLTILSWPFF